MTSTIRRRTTTAQGAPEAGRGRAHPEAAWPLHDRPGFLIRRAHQIHVGLFAETCAGFRVTPVQYSLLCALAERDQADQTTLAALVALDRTTTTGALKRLAARGLVHRATSAQDRRSHACRLTEAGHALTAAIEASARKAHEATLAPLTDDEARQLVALLKRVVTAHEGRVAGPTLR